MGRPKLLLPIGGEAAIRRTTRIVLQACPYVVVVVGSGAEAVARALKSLPRLIVIENAAWAEGMVGSAQAGGAWLRSRAESGEIFDGFFIHHGDMPFVDAAVFDALLDAWHSEGPGERLALAAARGGKAGHPVLFPISRLKNLLDLSPGERLKSILESGGSALVETACDGVLEDIDTPEDYRQLLDKYGFPEASDSGGGR